MSVEGHGRSRRGSGSSVGGQGGVIGDHLEVRCSLPKAMSISRSEILRRNKRTEVEKLMGDHGRSMGGHVRSVGVMGGQ